MKLRVSKLNKNKYRRQLSLKGQCHEMFDPFYKKNSTWFPYEQAKTVSQKFSFSRIYL